MTSRLKQFFSAEWWIPTLLILLSLVPTVAGAFRLTELASNAEITPDNARFFASPLPVVLHIVSVIIYSILGAFQFAPSFRRRRRVWHRRVGQLLIPSGFMAALSGLWMTHFYALPASDSDILYGLRLFFGWFMIMSLVFGVVAIGQRKFVQHGAWMIRAYAIGLGAGTQVFTHLPLLLFPFDNIEIPRAVAMGAGWVINLIVAEWLIRKRLAPQTRTTSVAVSHLP
jgi:uncharacterized membrane protein